MTLLICNVEFIGVISNVNHIKCYKYVIISNAVISIVVVSFEIHGGILDQIACLFMLLELTSAT